MNQNDKHVLKSSTINLINKEAVSIFIVEYVYVPREDAGGLSREYVLRIPSVS